MSYFNLVKLASLKDAYNAVQTAKAGMGGAGRKIGKPLSTVIGNPVTKAREAFRQAQGMGAATPKAGRFTKFTGDAKTSWMKDNLPGGLDHPMAQTYIHGQRMQQKGLLTGNMEMYERGLNNSGAVSRHLIKHGL